MKNIAEQHSRVVSIQPISLILIAAVDWYFTLGLHTHTYYSVRMETNITTSSTREKTSLNSTLFLNYLSKEVADLVPPTQPISCTVLRFLHRC